MYWGSAFKPIKVQELKKDYSGFAVDSKPTDILFPDKEKKYDRLIEGAWVDYNKGKYYLYYSGDNCCGGKANYAVMVATADIPVGPLSP